MIGVDRIKEEISSLAVCVVFLCLWVAPCQNLAQTVLSNTYLKTEVKANVANGFLLLPEVPGSIFSLGKMDHKTSM